jgi:predicted RecA/RadA family phage recombinase
MRNYLQAGATVTVTAPANVSSGDVVIVGALVGVAAAAERAVLLICRNH